MIKGKIDDIDLEILKILQKDSQTTYRKIKEELNLSVGTIHNHIQKLRSENGGPIEGYTVKLNHNKLGYNIMLLIRLEIDGNHLDEILNEIRTYPETCSIFYTTGEQPITMTCYFESLEKSHDFILGLIKNLYISNVTSNLVLNTYKNNQTVQIQ